LAVHGTIHGWVCWPGRRGEVIPMIQPLSDSFLLSKPLFRKGRMGLVHTRP
jgi:hypothetical protein